MSTFELIWDGVIFPYFIMFGGGAVGFMYGYIVGSVRVVQALGLTMKEFRARVAMRRTWLREKAQK